MRFFRGLGVNLRRSPFLGLSIRRATLPSSSSPQGNHFHLRSHATTPPTSEPKTSALALWNKLFSALVLLPSTCKFVLPSRMFCKRLSRWGKNKRGNCLSKQSNTLSVYHYRTLCCSIPQCRTSGFSLCVHGCIIITSSPTNARRA